MKRFFDTMVDIANMPNVNLIIGVVVGIDIAMCIMFPLMFLFIRRGCV